jgi:hypothetical protein
MQFSRRGIILGIGFVVCALVVVFAFVSHSGGNSGQMSSAQAKRLRIGESRTAVEKAVGAPLSSYDPDMIPTAPTGLDCVYYTRTDNVSQDSAALYRLCYRNGALDSLAAITDGDPGGGPKASDLP